MSKKRLYSTAAWYKLRARQLRNSPFCVYCAEAGHLTAATVADHIIPHRGSELLFYDAKNLQSLCKQCHDSAKQQLEKTGVLRGSTSSGEPLDKKSAWYR